VIATTTERVAIVAILGAGGALAALRGEYGEAFLAYLAIRFAAALYRTQDELDDLRAKARAVCEAWSSAAPLPPSG
jgi:hypothetical protein